jgi:hypothetical protein
MCLEDNWNLETTYKVIQGWHTDLRVLNLQVIKTIRPPRFTVKNSIEGR